MKKRSFTLVELLIVIGIIGLLAAMLFPALHKTTQQSRKTSCANNLHQIGLALNAYSNENTGRLPIAVRIGTGPADPETIPNIIDVKSEDLFKCPADRDAKYGGVTYFEKYGSCYEWNIWFNNRFIEKEKFNLAGQVLLSPIMSDADDFHGFLGKNYLYTDGHVNKILENPIE